MKRDAVIAAVLLLYALAWFVPVIKGGVSLPDGLPGWQAFRVALSPWIPYQDFKVEGGAMRLLAPLSALTNFVMLGALLTILAPSGSIRRALGWAAGVSFLVDASWIVFGNDRGDLRAGYYLWWVSFALLAALLVRPAAHANHTQPA